MLEARKALAEIIRAAAWRIWNARDERAEGVLTGQLTAQLADLTYAFACLEGAQHEVFPSTRQKTATSLPPKTATSLPPKTATPPPPKTTWS